MIALLDRTLYLAAALVLIASACSADDTSGTGPDAGPVCREGTWDIPSRDDAESICGSASTCTVCVQAEDDAGVPVTWAVFEESCRCPESNLP